MYTINQDSVSKDPYDDTHFIIALVMRIVSTVIMVFVVLFGSAFYSKSGKYVYQVLFYILVILNVL